MSAIAPMSEPGIAVPARGVLGASRGGRSRSAPRGAEARRCRSRPPGRGRRRRRRRAPGGWSAGGSRQRNERGAAPEDPALGRDRGRAEAELAERRPGRGVDAGPVEGRPLRRHLGAPVDARGVPVGRRRVDLDVGVEEPGVDVGPGPVVRPGLRRLGDLAARTRTRTIRPSRISIAGALDDDPGRGCRVTPSRTLQPTSTARGPLRGGASGPGSVWPSASAGGEGRTRRGPATASAWERPPEPPL